MDRNADEGFSEGLWLNKLPLNTLRICDLRHRHILRNHPVENAVHHLDENTYVSDGFFPCTSDIQYVLRKEGYSILLCMQYQLEEMEELFSITSIGQSIKGRILQRAKRLHLSGSDLLRHQFPLLIIAALYSVVADAFASAFPFQFTRCHQFAQCHLN